MVTLDQLVPRDHLLRLVDTPIRFDFIREKTEGLYCLNNGRPAIDPVMLFKMSFIGYLFGVLSERQLVRELEVNVAYRWLLGLLLTDKVPDASTLSQNRRRRFSGTGIEQDIFDTIVEQAIGHKLIGSRVLHTDSTHLKAVLVGPVVDCQLDLPVSLRRLSGSSATMTCRSALTRSERLLNSSAVRVRRRRRRNPTRSPQFRICWQRWR